MSKTQQPQPLDPQALQRLLSQQILPQSKVAILGVGSEILGDDAVGTWIAETIQLWIQENPCHGARAERIRAMPSHTAPENFTGEIIQFAPDVLIIIDAAKMGFTPGTLALLDPATIRGISFSSHTLPIPIVLNYLRDHAASSRDLRPLIFGIEPKGLAPCVPMSSEVKATAQEMVRILQSVLSTD